MVFSCAFLFAFYLLARISNIVPASARLFDPSKHLCRGDVKTTEFGLQVTFRWSKTNQSGYRRLILPLLHIPNSLLCPVRMYHEMCTLIPIPDCAPAFSVLTRSRSYTTITKSQFVEVLRSRLTRLQITDPRSFRGHSFRRGGATWAFSSGIPGELIQVFGDWASDAYKCYLEFSMGAKLCVARRI